MYTETNLNVTPHREREAADLLDKLLAALFLPALQLR